VIRLPVEKTAKALMLTYIANNCKALVQEAKEARSKNQATAYKRKFTRYELVIIDELGYVSFDKQGNEILFNLLSNRNETGSMIVTTNLAFEKREEVFHDTNLTGVLVDRITHKAHILDMTGKSYRLKETKQLLGK
jgi:DNA replication protein DnaC